MASLKDKVVSDTLDQVEVVYLDRATAKWWNARKRDADTATFCGWFWIRGDDEGGPFKTRSSAIRDSYYRFILMQEPPAVGHKMLPPRRKNSAKIHVLPTSRRVA